MNYKISLKCIEQKFHKANILEQKAKEIITIAKASTSRYSPIYRNIEQISSKPINAKEPNTLNILLNYADKYLDHLLFPIKIHKPINSSHFRVNSSKKLEFKNPDEILKNPYIDIDSCGSRAIIQTTNETVSTGGIWQCAALAIIDKKEKTQTLAHLIQFERIENIKEFLTNNLKSGWENRSEIFVIPGKYQETKRTVYKIITALKELDKNIKIQFKHFKGTSDELVLSEGKIFVTNDSPSIISKNAKLISNK